MTTGARAARLVSRLDALAAITSDPGAITRLPFTDEHARANDTVAGWMAEAGMTVSSDAAGNLFGRYEAASPGAPALMIGSHLDSVRDGGRFDGPLGVLAGVEVVAALAEAGQRLPVAVEVAAFWDEEGARFPGCYLGSRAAAGQVPPGFAEATDADGITLGQAMVRFGLDPGRVAEASRRDAPPRAWLELHIEQGPVLERAGLALGCVTAIAGSRRLHYDVTGEVGHAGTLPMARRRDAAAAAAECTLIVERVALAHGIVGTVGVLRSEAASGNVVPGRARFSVDLRDGDDARLDAAMAKVSDGFAGVAERRGVTITPVSTLGSAAVACAPELRALIRAALEAHGHPARELQSGAGHDGIAMSTLCPVGMIFVRCRGGISHSPEEFTSEADIAAALDVLDTVVARFRPA